MMWQTQVERLLLLELLARSRVRRRAAQAAAYQALAELPWTRLTGRRDEIELVEERRPELLALIDRIWPAWTDALADLTALGLPPTPEGWDRLEDAHRAANLPALPEQLNRRTAAALAAPHSKAPLTRSRLSALGATEPTHDGAVRLRPPPGLTARTLRGAVDLAAVAKVLGEVAVPERALADGFTLEGEVRAVLLVENLGAWRDLPDIGGWLLAHVPGWDTSTVLRFLDCLAPHVPVVHFGDLDPNGVRIVLHLRERCARLQWFTPPFWRELIPSRARRAPWPEGLDLSTAPGLVRELAAQGLWLEQEPLVLDQRTVPAIEAML